MRFDDCGNANSALGLLMAGCGLSIEVRDRGGKGWGIVWGIVFSIGVIVNLVSAGSFWSVKFTDQTEQFHGPK